MASRYPRSSKRPPRASYLRNGPRPAPPHLPLAPFEPRDPHFETRVRASFHRQRLMQTLGARLGALVSPEGTTGENTVVGVGANVVRDLPANAVAVSNPARGIRLL